MTATNGIDWSRTQLALVEAEERRLRSAQHEFQTLFLHLRNLAAKALIDDSTPENLERQIGQLERHRDAVLVAIRSLQDAKRRLSTTKQTDRKAAGKLAAQTLLKRLGKIAEAIPEPERNGHV